MTIWNNSFDQLFISECLYGSPKIDGSTLEVTVRNVGLLPGHPGNPDDSMIYLPTATMTFEGVTKSVRELLRYRSGEPRGDCYPPEIVEDGPFPKSQEPGTVFGLEGILESPCAWLDWEIEAARFSLESV